MKTKYESIVIRERNEGNEFWLYERERTGFLGIIRGGKMGVWFFDSDEARFNDDELSDIAAFLRQLNEGEKCSHAGATVCNDNGHIFCGNCGEILDKEPSKEQEGR